MTTRGKELLNLAKENPYWHFTVEELVEITALSKTTLEMMIRADDSPFVTSKSRPERVLAWLEKHPGWKPSQER